MAEILAVDDELWSLEFLAAALQDKGYSCTPVRSGQEALACCGSKVFDLLIVDRHMPGMDGITLIQTVRRDPRFQRAKILMCSAANLAGELSDAFEAGADDYLLKPYSIEDLARKVARLLG